MNARQPAPQAQYSAAETEMRQRLDSWVVKGKVMTLAISRHPSDPQSRHIDFNILRVPLHSAWLPPAGSSQKVMIRKTRAGAYYAVPANLRELPAGEFDPDRQLFFRETLKKSHNGFYHFRQPSGRILVPIDQDFWQELDKAYDSQLVGQRIELTGWPKTTCCLVMPAHANALDTTEVCLGVIQEQFKRQIVAEREIGIIRVTIDSQDLPILATTILGMTREDELSAEFIKRKYTKSMKACPENKNSMPIGNKEICRAAYIKTLQDARELLTTLAEQGIKRIADLYPSDGKESTTPFKCDICGELVAMIAPEDYVQARIFDCKCGERFQLSSYSTLVAALTEDLGLVPAQVVKAAQNGFKDIGQIYQADIAEIRKAFGFKKNTEATGLKEKVQKILDTIISPG